MARAKIQDVARLAGVSLSTVSAVINGKTVVSAKTRQRVIDTIAELRYKPSLYASNLARRDLRILGVIVSNLQNPFFAETAQAIEDEAIRAGYTISLAATNFSPELLRAAVHQLLGARISGLAVITSERDKSAFDVIEQSGVPSVFLDVGRVGPTSTNIRVDSRGGMMAAVQHLIELGHRDLLLVRNSQKAGRLLSHRHRHQGFAAGVKACNITDLRTHVVDVEGLGADAGLEAIASAYGRIPFTAVMAVTDMVALGVYRGLQARGVSIPEDVSVVGFDNTYFSRFLHPPLTTVDIPRAELSRLIVTALTSIQREQPGSSLKLPTTLLIRESTAAPRHSGSATTAALRLK